MKYTHVTSYIYLLLRQELKGECNSIVRFSMKLDRRFHPIQ